MEEIGGLVLREDPSLVRNKDFSSLEAHREIPERKAKVVVCLVDGGVGERLSQVQTEPVFLLRAKPEFRRFCTVFQLEPTGEAFYKAALPCRNGPVQPLPFPDLKAIIKVLLCPLPCPKLRDVAPADRAALRDLTVVLDACLWAEYILGLIKGDNADRKGFVSQLLRRDIICLLYTSDAADE